MDIQRLEYDDETTPKSKASSALPDIIDTYTPSLKNSSHNLERMGAGRETIAQINIELDRATKEVERARELFAAHGITVRSAYEQPQATGDTTSYTLLGKIDRENREHDVLLRSIPELVIPERRSLREALEDFPEPPFVAKHTGDQGGMNKFLVEADWQQERLMTWARDKSYLSPDWMVEQFIAGPSEYATSYRIVVGATGLPIAASLIRSDKPRQTGELIIDESRQGWERELISPTSPTFIGAREFRSNAAANGHIIPLAINGQCYATKTPDEIDQHVLEQHGIIDQQLPAELLDLSTRIGKLIGPGKALVLGIDFVQGHDGRFYFMEANAVPSVETVRLWWNIDSNESNDEVYRQLYETIAKDMVRIYGASLTEEA